MERGLPRVAVEEPAAANGGGLLGARADELAHGYEELAAEAEAAAVRWRWATPTSGHGDREPVRLERMGCAPGRSRRRPTATWSRSAWSAWPGRRVAGCTPRRPHGRSTRRSASTLWIAWCACAS